MRLAPCSVRVSPARELSMKRLAVPDEAALHAALRSHFQEGTA